MDLLAGIKTYIFILSSCILYPVLILLAGLSVWIFYECGSFFACWLKRKKLALDAESEAVLRYGAELEKLLSATDREEDVQHLLLKPSVILGKSSKIL